MEKEILGQVQENAVRRLGWSNAKTTNLFVDKRVVSAGAVVKAYDEEIAIKRDTVLVFADEAPLYNWGHRCRYMLYDAASAELYNEISSEFPPYLTTIPDTYEAFHEPVRFTKELKLFPIKPSIKIPRIIKRGTRYAILFAGAANNRHTNDLEFLYRTLIDHYDFKDDNVYCLNYDGTINYSGGPQPVANWPGDSTPYRMPVKGEGSRAALDAVIDELKGKLKIDDVLLIHTNNHGGWSGWGQSYLVTYSGPGYYAADFASKLTQLPKFYCLMVMMEQCHSGGFNAPIIAHSPAQYTTVSSACVEQNNSIGGADFDPFARDWIAAIAGHVPSGGALASNPDINANGRVSARESHEYANAIHDPYDTPIYNENAIAAGDTYLGQRYTWSWWWKPWIVEQLQSHYVRMPSPEFYSHIRNNLIPRFEELEREVGGALDARTRDLETRVKDLATKAL